MGIFRMCTQRLRLGRFLTKIQNTRHRKQRSRFLQIFQRIWMKINSTRLLRVLTMAVLCLSLLFWFAPRLCEHTFEADDYYTSVESAVRSLFPEEIKPRSYGDVQMSFLRSVDLFILLNKTAYIRDRRAVGFLYSRNSHFDNPSKDLPKSEQFKPRNKLRSMATKNNIGTKSNNEDQKIDDNFRNSDTIFKPSVNTFRNSDNQKQNSLVNNGKIEQHFKISADNFKTSQKENNLKATAENENWTVGNNFKNPHKSVKNPDLKKSKFRYDLQTDAEKTDTNLHQQSLYDNEQQNIKFDPAQALPPENPALRDFRKRAQRVSKLCPAIENSFQGYFAKLRKSCERLSNEYETVKGVFWHEKTKTSYCYVPKAGCTFWIRVFAFLNNRTGLVAETPWDLPRLAIHNITTNAHARGRPLCHFREAVMSPDSLRFVVTRDPYSRLWSAYVDKFLLPDFWQNSGREIVKKARFEPTDRAERCGNDVTFPEFIQYVLHNDNSHWDPIHLQCNPCRYQPQVIADISTFSRDSNVILRRLGLEDTLSELNRTEQKVLELQTLIQYNFDVLETRLRDTNCLTHTRLARLLWKVFQINGYLPVQALYSSRSEEEFSVAEFTRQVLEEFRESAKSLSLSVQLSSQKKYFMEEAFRSLDEEQLQALKRKYALDFQLFGYKDSPFSDG